MFESTLNLSQHSQTSLDLTFESVNALSAPWLSEYINHEKLNITRMNKIFVILLFIFTRQIPNKSQLDDVLMPYVENEFKTKY